MMLVVVVLVVVVVIAREPGAVRCMQRPSPVAPADALTARGCPPRPR